MVPNHKGEIPAALLLLPFALGIIIGINIFPALNLNFLVTAFSICCVVFILFNINYNRLRFYKQRWVGGSLICIILLVFGWTLTLRYNELRSPDHFSKLPAQFLVANISSEPVLKNGLFRFTAAVKETINGSDKHACNGTLLIAIKDSSAKKLNYGDQLLLPVNYTAIDPPFNPAEFNYKQYLAHKNIFYQAYLYPHQYVVLKTGAGNALMANSISLRRALVEKLRQNMRDSDAVGVASAMLLGYRADLSSDVLETYSKTGTVYVLTVSGAQVAILYFVLAYVLSFLDRFKYGKLVKAIIIILIIWYYAMLTGFSVAVCRAALMLSFVLIGKAAARYISTFNILAISAFMLLCYDPFFITEAGFQLSYLAMFGILILRPVIYNRFHFQNKIADKTWAICSFSIAIQMAIFPLCLACFHQFPTYFLLSNLLVIVPSAIIMYAGIFFLLLPKIPFLSAALAFVLEQTTAFMNKMLALIEHLPGATVDKIWLTGPDVLLLCIIVMSLFFFWYRKEKLWLKGALTGCLIFCLSCSIKNIRQSSAQSIAWLNVGEHPAIIFKNGNSGIVLTDLHPADKAYKYSIQPYLDSCQVNKTETYDLDADINIPWFKKRRDYVQFLNSTAFIYRGKLDPGIFSPKLKADIIYITCNPDPDLNILSGNFNFQALVVGSANSNNKIAGWKKQLSPQQTNYKILKRNKSFICISN